MIYFDGPWLMSNHRVGRLPSGVACVLVCLQLITLVWAVISKSFAVWAEFFLVLWLLGPIVGGCAVSGWGRVFFVVVPLAAGSSNQGVHLFQHGVHVGFVSGGYCLHLLVVLFLLQCKKHGLGFSFLLCSR